MVAPRKASRETRRLSMSDLLAGGLQGGLLGDDERPGALRRLATVETAVQEIKTQLSPNSGGSLHDKVTRIDERTVLFGERLDLHAERLDKQTKALDEHLVAPHPRR